MRPRSSIRPLWSFLLLCFLSSYVSAHTVLTYPGWRGNTLHTNGTVEGVSGLGIGMENDTLVYPYGMEWAYPCGGIPQSENRTKWPVGGGAVAFQPGWFQGHKTAFIYINLGLGTIPPNMSHPMIAPFQLVGPTKNPYPGTFCMPQVPLPAGITVNVGDNATIQLIETAVHGAALYNCVDITFAEPEDVEPVTRDNCFNSSQLSANLIFAMDSDPTSSSAISVIFSPKTGLAALPLFLIGFIGSFL